MAHHEGHVVSATELGFGSHTIMGCHAGADLSPVSLTAAIVGRQSVKPDPVSPEPAPPDIRISPEVPPPESIWPIRSLVRESSIRGPFEPFRSKGI